MRSLVILRGSPASGKSSWVKDMNLENYCLSADNIRLLVQSPIMSATERHREISQKNDSYVWQLLFELLEERMKRGEFIIVDATHSRSSDFSRYNKLCERYRYRRYYVDFSDVPIEICKERNKKREDYKRVPDSVIDKMYARLNTQQKTSGWVEAEKGDLFKIVGTKLFNMNEYEKIHIFGDIHGCYEPLKKYFDENPFNEKEFYIFVGDYFDRGIQNKEVALFLFSIYDKKNVLLLEGNHEKWVNYYANDELENIKSNTFLKKTMPEIIDIDKVAFRNLYRKLGQMAYFEYDDKRYIVSHGGISYIPEELQLIATEQLISGVGDYNVTIDEVFSRNEQGNNIIQVHGHRNTYEIDNYNSKSYNLEGKVEFGGNLKILQLQKGKSPLMYKIKNNTFLPQEESNEFRECKSVVNNYIDIVQQLQISKDIRENKLENNISSFNFTHKAFYNKSWNDLTCKARGLFIDMNTKKVVARGYEKFFNVNEVKETELEHLLVKFKDKHITCYKKENGFLGILSMVNDELFFASKSTNNGEFVDYFKNIYKESNINEEYLKNYLSENNVSLVFEVIDVVHDPHIIEYEKSKIVLLDIITNDFEFSKRPYNEVQELAKNINCECKIIYKEFDDIRQFHKWYLENTDEDNIYTKEDIEGVVIECDNFMTKLKFPYYKFWKFMRSLKDTVKRNSKIKLASLYNAEANYFYSWLKDNKDIIDDDIITLRKKYYAEKDNYIKQIEKQ